MKLEVFRVNQMDYNLKIFCHTFPILAVPLPVEQTPHTIFTGYNGIIVIIGIHRYVVYNLP